MTTYALDNSISAPTVIYLNKDAWYSNGYKVAVEAENSSDKTKLTENEHSIEIMFDESALSKSVTVTVTAAPERS